MEDKHIFDFRDLLRMHLFKFDFYHFVNIANHVYLVLKNPQSEPLKQQFTTQKYV